jgi:hypothetical protein
MRALAAVVALLLLVVAFAALAPATLIDARVAALTQDRVRLADADGTVWSGTGQLADAHGRWRVPIARRVGAAALLRGDLDVTLVPATGNAARGSIVAREGRFAVRDLHLESSASALETAWATALAPALGGEVSVDAPAFRTDGVRGNGSFEVRWQRARASMAGMVLDLGTLEGHGRGADDAITVDLVNRGGDVGIAGVARATPESYAVDLTLKPAATLPPALMLALRALGTPAADGSVHVTWQGPR